MFRDVPRRSHCYWESSLVDFHSKVFQPFDELFYKKQKVKYLGKKSRFQEDSGTSERRSLIGYQLRAARSFLTGVKFN